jgi:polyisoprenoid-binding protein YceI
MSRAVHVAVLITLSCAVSTGQVKTVNAVPSESSMSYFLVHPLHHIEATSKEITSTVTADASTHAVTGVSMTVDVSTFDSGNSNRDSHAMEVIDAISFPEARFTGDSFEAKGDSLLVSGNLTFHGVTKRVTVRSLPQWGQGTLTVAGILDISLTEFHIDRPSLLMIPVDDELHFTLHAVYRW